MSERVWEAIQEYQRRKQATQARALARRLAWFAYLTPPAPAGSRETAAGWAVQAILKTGQENT